ncbi:hypothetical protein FM131_04620 [Weissella confusa]|uniref:hypothetical protein n=1 Tax=Weissella confusa TaxID=1583 RepID=UPI000989A153|nr:hypothetical protein [Weissella confusa]SJX68669.1 hypothetical protein FM131_04620 [Weissella confusa]
MVKKIEVYDISDEVNQEILDDESIKNISKVFDKIFDPNNTAHIKVTSQTKEGSVYELYHGNEVEFDTEIFAKELLAAERKNDGTRNEQITEGNLFILQENGNLYLLKLENIEVVDKMDHYKMRRSFSTESNYYKGAIFTGDLKNILIIDKNPRLAKYWSDKFLNVAPIKNEYANTDELIKLIKSDALFSNSVLDQRNYEEVKRATENYLFDNVDFDKLALSNMLNREKLISEKDLNNIFSEESQKIDTEFKVSQSAIKQAYKKTTRVSDDTKIYTDNYDKLYGRQEIKFEEGRIIIKVSKDYIDQIPEELRQDNE